MTPIIVTGGPWPERVGLSGWQLSPPDAPKRYPWKGIGRNEVIVFLPADPLNLRPARDELMRSWTCVMSKQAITPA